MTSEPLCPPLFLSSVWEVLTPADGPTFLANTQDRAGDPAVACKATDMTLLLFIYYQLLQQM